MNAAVLSPTEALAHVERFDGAVRAIRAEQWSAWKLGERDSRPLALDAPETLDEAVAQAMATCCPQRGDRLAIHLTHAGKRKATLWLYEVKQSATIKAWRPASDGSGRKVAVHAMEAKLWLQTEALFSPVEAFDAFRDDASGRDCSLVEAR